MKHVLSVGLLIVSLNIGIFRAEDGRQVNKLANIRKIYIGDLGREEGSDLVREKIRIRLMKAERFNVVEHPEAADAVLTGVAGVVRGYSTAASGAGSTSFAGTGVLRLVDVKTEETIWVFEYKRRFGFSTQSSKVADATVEELLKDAQPRSEKKKRRGRIAETDSDSEIGGAPGRPFGDENRMDSRPE